jgi:flagellar hook-basal body complex protein FliE
LRIDGLNGLNIPNAITQLNKDEQVGQQGGNVFAMFLDSYMNILGETNRLENNALNLQLDYATGRNDDILAVMLAQEQAFVSLNFTVQITNKIIEAYREIMRIAM